MRRVLLLWCLSLFLAIGVGAAVIQVPADQPTIQAGIDAAVNGDTVLVSDGTYSGVGNRNITYNGKAIVVRSVNGAAVTIVDVDSTLNRGFIFNSGEDTMSVLDGFTVTRAIADSGAGILISGGSPKVLNCRFEKFGFTFLNYNGNDLSLHAPLGLGVGVVGNSNPVIRSSVFANTIIAIPAGYGAGQLYGGGLGIDVPAKAKIEDCSFEDIGGVHVDGGLGVAIFDGSQGSVYCRCKILRNFSYFYHGGTQSVPVLLLNSTSQFDSCLFARNFFDWSGGTGYPGCGGIWLNNSPATISNCTFFGNTTTGSWPEQLSAMAILCTHSKASITGCNIAFNSVVAGFKSDNIPWMPAIAVGPPGDTIVPIISCTNIYGNDDLLGDWVGPLASQLGINGNIRRNPYFCDTTNYDFHLAPNSPCVADSTGCGLMGAYQMNPSCAPGNCCIGRAGNIDCDPYDRVDISDLTAIIDCLYINPFDCSFCCPGEANVDGDPGGGFDIADLSALIDYLYISFNPPAMCQ